MTDDRDDFGDATSPTTDLFGSVPDHRPGFWVDLDRRLAEDQGGSVPPAEAVDDERPTIPPIVGSTPVQPAETGVVDLASHPRTARRRAWQPLVAAAAAAAIVLVAVVARPWSTDDARLDVGGTSTDVSTPDATATTGPTVHLTYLERQLGAAFSGQPVDDAYETTSTLEFSAAEDGSYRIEYDAPGASYSRDGYDATTGTTWGAYDDGSNAGTFAQANDGILTSRLPYVLQRSTVGAFALSTIDPDGDSYTVSGRPALRIETDLSPNQIGGGPDRISAVFDQTTGLPLELNEYSAGELTRTLELVAADWDAGLSAETFAVPADADVIDRGIAPTDDPASVVGESLPMPPSAFDGFELVAVQAAAGPPDYVTGSEGSNPAASAVLVATYRAPWRTYRVAFIAYEDEGYGFSDPILGEGDVQAETEFVLTEPGRFAGVTAELVHEPSAVPHIWGTSDGLAFVVTGDLSADALVQVAESIGR